MSSVVLIAGYLLKKWLDVTTSSASAGLTYAGYVKNLLMTVFMTTSTKFTVVLSIPLWLLRICVHAVRPCIFLLYGIPI